MHGAGLQPAKAEVLLGKNGMWAKDENSYRYMAFYKLLEMHIFRKNSDSTKRCKTKIKNFALHFLSPK